MKTLKKISFAVLLVFAISTSASEKETSLDNSKNIKVEFKNVKKGHTIVIKDNNGVLIYSGKVKTSGNYAKMFNFSALNDGLYTAELNKDFEIIVKTLSIKDGTVTISENNTEKIFKPVIRNSKNILYVSKLSFNNKPLKVVIYFNDEIILSETVEGSKKLERIYKLSNNETGTYKVVASSDNRTYVKEILL